MRIRPIVAPIVAAAAVVLFAAPAVAALRVEPRLTLRGEYDTNIISLGYEGVDGMLFIIAPSIGLQGEILRLNLMVDAGVDVWRYKDLDPNDGIDLTVYNAEVPFAKASIGRNFANRLSVDLGLGYRNDLNLTHRFDSSNDLMRTPSDYYNATLKLAWAATNRAKVQGGLTYDRLIYEDERGVGDSVSLGGDLGLSYQMTERLSLRAAGYYERREYDPDDPTTTTSVGGQMSYRFSRTLTVEANGSVDYVEPGAGLDPRTLWTAAVVAKREGPKALVQTNLYRMRGKVRENGGIPQTDGISVKVSYKATTKLTLQVTGMFQVVDYSEIPLENTNRKDDFLKGTVWVTYEAYRDIFLRGDYAYIHRDSTVDAYDYGNHQVGISLVGRVSLF